MDTAMIKNGTGRGHNNPRQRDLTGHRFGRWLVIGNRMPKPSRWFCLCSCGTERYVSTCNLVTGASQSCGCLFRDSNPNVTHGRTDTPEYRVWYGMRERCRNPNNKRFGNYGGRGITICSRWDSFINFFLDMGCRPSPRHSIDRIDVHGNYEPDNCRWATPTEQGRNTTRNRRLTLNGKTMTVSEWSEVTGINDRTIMSRIAQQGWSDERALTEPVANRGQRK